MVSRPVWSQKRSWDPVSSLSNWRSTQINLRPVRAICRTDGWDRMGLVIIGHRSSKSTFGANKHLFRGSFQSCALNFVASALRAFLVAHWPTTLGAPKEHNNAIWLWIRYICIAKYLDWEIYFSKIYTCSCHQLASGTERNISMKSESSHKKCITKKRRMS